MSRVQEPVEAFIDRTSQEAAERRVARSNRRFTSVLACVALATAGATALVAAKNSQPAPITSEDIQDAAECAALESGGQKNSMARSVQLCESMLGIELGDQFGYTVSIANSLIEG